MFLDPSAIIALLLGEPEAEELSRRLEAAGGRRVTSPVVLVESAVNLARISRVPMSAAWDLVHEFLDVAGVEVIPITGEIGHGALQAYSRFGKGTRHPAQLNLADAFSYACAARENLALLYKGTDFSRTDLA